MRDALKTAHPLVQLCVLTLLGFGAMFVLFFLMMIPELVSGGDINALVNPALLTAEDKGGIFFLKLLQIVQALGLFITPYLLYVYVVGDTRYGAFRLNGRLGMLAVFGFSVLAAVPFINFLAEWNAQLVLPEVLSGLDEWMRSTEAKAEGLVRLFLTMDSVGDLLFNLILIAIIPAVAEEFFFRGTVQPIMLRTVKNYHAAIWITAFLFSFFHMQFLGFVPRFLLGAVFGYAAHWSGSLALPMLGHLINNGLAVLLVWFVGLETLDQSVETLGGNEGEWHIALISLTVLSVGLLSVWKSSQRLNKA